MDDRQSRTLMRLFLAYVRAFEARLPDRLEHIVLKRDHSLRVHALACRIVTQEKLAPAPVILAAALLHDLGRFTQVERYATYRDDQSVDHGDLGAEVLAEQRQFLDAFSDEMQDRIIETVRLHNKRVLPDGLDPLVQIMCGVVRDADKLDIIPVVIAQMQPNGPRDEVVTLGLADEPEKWSAEVVDALLAGESPAYTQLVYINDFKLLLASWGNRLENAASRKMFLSRGYLEQLFALLPAEHCFAELKNYFSERLTLS